MVADMKAASSGKVPSALPQKKPAEATSSFDEDKQLAEIAKKLMDETALQAEKIGKHEKSAKKAGVSSAAKKAEALAESSIVKTDSEPLGSQDAPPSFPKKPSRESSGKIRAADAMKLVTPQQQALHHYQKALSLLQQGRVSEARSGLEDALRLDQYQASARQALAGLLVEQKQFQAAELVLQEGVNLNAEQYGFAMALARLQVERGDARAALETLYRSLPHAMDNAGYQAFLAALLQRTDQHKKAIEYYQAALQLAPSAAWQMGLGISMQAEHRLADALEAFNQAKASNDLAPDLLAFVEQRLRSLRKGQAQVSADVKVP